MTIIHFEFPITGIEISKSDNRLVLPISNLSAWDLDFYKPSRAIGTDRVRGPIIYLWK